MTCCKNATLLVIQKKLFSSFVSDLLCVIAHGTPSARAPAANLLFYYWPNLNPTHYDRRNMLNRFDILESEKCFRLCFKTGF